ncbi:MAG: hypothetical protein E6Q97_12495 [Desulfurellales bacterium]|nr:MAG: hypothetical protein E6Q97_12495 [Desulfurellales bacterium]
MKFKRVKPAHAILRFGDWVFQVGYLDTHGEEAGDWIHHAAVPPYVGVRGVVLRRVESLRYPLAVLWP